MEETSGKAVQRKTPFQDDSSCDIDFEDNVVDSQSSVDDLLTLDSALHGSEYYKDLGMPDIMQQPTTTDSSSRFLQAEVNSSSCPGSLYSQGSSNPAEMANYFTFEERSSSEDFHDLNGAEDTGGECDMFPMLVRSMSTSRRHSWEAPLSPVGIGRRLSLDPTAIESDEDQRNEIISQIHPLALCPEALSESPEAAATHRLETEDSEEYDLSKSPMRVPNKVAADHLPCSLETIPVVEGTERETELGKRPVPEEQSRMLMVQQVLEELKQYHGAKQRTAQSAGKQSTSQNVTWYEFLSNEQDEEEKVDKVEKGTRVKRRLSSLKNRVTGSFQKDKGKNREKEKEKEKEKTNTSTEHQLAPGTFSSWATCTLCSKVLQKKNGLQCLTAASLKEQHRCVLPAPNGSPRSQGMTIVQRGSSSHPVPTTSPTCTTTTGSSTGEMDEVDLRYKLSNEDTVSLAPSTVDSIVVEDVQYASLRSELDLDSQDLEAETWSMAVEQTYLKQYSQQAIKRQDVIYELAQTEMHHVRTLKIMLHVYAREMKETLQMDEEKVDKIFPCLENLLDIHRQFLARLKEKRRDCLEEGSERNYCISRIGDLLVWQFSGEAGNRMKESYGGFCSRHTEAMATFKELLQTNKKMSSLMKKIGYLAIVKRLGVPECILLVTQRITKYPPLVERILQNTEGGSVEHEELTRALALIKDLLMQVDLKVSIYERSQKLKEIVSKMEPKACAKFKDGRIFRKEHMRQGANSVPIAEILAVLLTDVLLLLQEKDQKYAFAPVDNKPPVISLQKLIVREVAHEEKGMFLICASSKEPEMYEIHTNSKEERNAWITLIRQAVESCPAKDDGLGIDPEEERRSTEMRAARLREFQDRLSEKDRQIAQNLNEKLQIFCEISEMISGVEESSPGVRFRQLPGDFTEVQAEQLVKDAVVEDGSIKKKSHTLSYCDIKGRERRTQQTVQDSQGDSEGVEPAAEDFSTESLPTACSTAFPDSEAFVSQQDSALEIQKATTLERERQSRLKGDVLLEQEKQRNFEKQREEMAALQKLQNQLQQERQRLHREREQHQCQAEAQQAILREREEECSQHQRQLQQEREELRQQWERYQLDLERLRESTRAVEKEKEKLEQMKKMKSHKLPNLDASPHHGLTHSYSFNGEGGQITEGPVQLPGKPLNRNSTIGPDYMERPDIPSRRDSSSGDSRLGQVPKPEVPIHLVSTTNQLLKQAGVQQQIPTKLAAISKGKEKGGKGKGSQRTESTASADIKQFLPPRLSGKDDSFLRGRRSVSPTQSAQPGKNCRQPLRHLRPDEPSLTFPSWPFLPEAQTIQDIPADNAPLQHKPSSLPMLPTLPPPLPFADDTVKEDVIFF
ncbi:ARHGI factor, partial [Polypterus senegalus]